MEWRDEGLIIGIRRHGEASMIVEAMTRAHGRHLGLVRGGRSARLRATLQPGNTVGLVWRARLDEHLGSFAVEPSDAEAVAAALSRLLDAPDRRADLACAGRKRVETLFDIRTIAGRMDDFIDACVSDQRGGT